VSLPLRALGRSLGLSALARLRLRLWLGRRVHRSIGRLQARRGVRPVPPPAPGLVLLYHRVGPAAREWEPTRPLSVPQDLFRAQMEELRSRFQPVSLDRLLDPAAGPPERSEGLPPVAVTFDDGYRDNLELAHPILQSLGIPAAVFVNTAWLGQPAPFWWCELEELIRRGALGRLGRSARWTAYAGEVSRMKRLSEEERARRFADLRARAGRPPPGPWAPLLVSEEELRQMEASGLWTAGGHTHRHTILSRLPLAAARAEIEENKRRLEEVLGHPVRWFAYPNGGEGDFGPEHIELLRQAGYRGALSGLSPFERREVGPFSVPRLAVSGLEGLAEFKNHLSGIFWPRRRRARQAAG
jgi:peptidoglycan/xylan/chitin deacetylase (PgdA/CDA1 family)